MKTLTKYIHNYTLRPEIRHPLKQKPDAVHLKNTIKLYKSIHPTVANSYLSKLQPIVQKLLKHDKLIFIEEEKISFHIYMFLFHIHRYIDALDFYYGDNYKKTFAKHKGAKEKLFQEHEKNHKESLEFDNAFPEDNVIKSEVYLQFVKNKKLTDIFVNFYTVFPISNINFEALDTDKTFAKVLVKIVEHFNSTYLQENVIYHSIAIVLNGYLRLKMCIPSSHAQRLVSEILYELFGFELQKTSADLLRNIYIGGRLNGIPIFKNSKSGKIFSDTIKQEFQHFFDTQIFPEFGLEINDLNLSYDDYFNENPLQAYFQQYPIEFLSKIE